MATFWLTSSDLSIKLHEPTGRVLLFLNPGRFFHFSRDSWQPYIMPKAHAENGSICSFWTDPHNKQTVLRWWIQCYLYCGPVLSIKMTSQMMNVVVISPQCCSSGRKGNRCEAPQRPSVPHLLHHSVSVWKERGWEEMYSFLPNLYGGQDVSSSLWFSNDPVLNDSAVFLELSLKPGAAFPFSSDARLHYN